MSASSEPVAGQLLLAVDAGGTKSDACLAIADGAGNFRVLGLGRSSAGNPLSVGFDAASRAIGEAIQLARKESGRPTDKITRAVFSIAGAAGPELRSQFTAWARKNAVAERLAFVSDVLPVLAAGTPDCCGVALISGTGSSAFGRSADGRTTLVGGWGYILGDDGSGFAIGRAAVRFALEDLEANTSLQPLTRTVLDELRAKSTRDITEAVYRSAEPRAVVASLAPRILELADTDDASAKTILNDAAHDLALIAARAAKFLGWANGPFPLALGGGVLVASTRLQQLLEEHLRRQSLSPQAQAVSEPIDGCLRLTDPAFATQLVEWT
jgi:N-acetylglucosamine kinase-like BadF-type ATPase